MRLEFCQGLPTLAFKGHLLAWQERSLSPGLPDHQALTQKLVEGVGDRVIPAALEESQTSWSHGFLVFLVEIKSAEGPLGQLVAMGRRAAFEWEGARQAILGNPWNPPRTRDYCQVQDLHQEQEGARATTPELAWGSGDKQGCSLPG